MAPHKGPYCALVTHATCLSGFYPALFTDPAHLFSQIYLLIQLNYFPSSTRVPSWKADSSTVLALPAQREDLREDLQRRLERRLAEKTCREDLQRRLARRFAELQNCKIAELQNCKITELQNCRIAKLQNCKIAKLQNCKILELQNCRVASYRVASLPSCQLTDEEFLSW